MKFPNDYKEFPEEFNKRLQITHETYIVDEHHVHVYAPKDNDGTIIKGPRSVDLFRNSIATPSLVVSLINSKYVNALPIERQKSGFKNKCINLETNTMCNWIINATEKISFTCL